MSMVIGFTTGQFAVISGDTRATYTGNGEVKHDDAFHKIFRVNNNILVGFTGNGDGIRVLKDYSFLKRPDDEYADKYASRIFDELGGHRIDKPFNMMIIGRTVNKTGWATIFNTDDSQPQVNKEFINQAMVFPFPPADGRVDANYLVAEYTPSLANILHTSVSVEQAITRVAKFQEEKIKSISNIVQSVNSLPETYSLKFE